MKRLFLILFCLLIVFCVTGSQIAFAGAVITSGPLSLGVNDEGHLVYNSVGLALDGLGDAITPGCYWEGWGIAGNGISGGESIDNDKPGNLTLDSFTSTASTATSIVHLTTLADIVITHEIAPSAGAPNELFEFKVTIENTGVNLITDIRYRRNMDWDIPPTEFEEIVTIQGHPAGNLIFSNDNGFYSVDPLDDATGSDLAGCGETVNFIDCGPADHGALFDFGFGDLPAGDSINFSIFFGAATTEADALDALSAVGAEVYSLGQSNGGEITGAPGTFIFGFKGVGGQPIQPTTSIPTLSEWGMIIMSLILAGSAIWMMRRRQMS